MAEVLASLKKIGGNGEQYTETSLWTNPDTSATFAAQNVTLSDSLSNYKYIGIRFAYNTTYKTGEYISTLLQTVADFRKFGYSTGVRRNGTAICISDTSNKAYERMCIYISDTSVRFNTCFQAASSTQSNTAAIPLEILGINELAHGKIYENYATGYFTNTVRSVDLGFVPKYVFCANGGSASGSNNSNIIIYDANVSTTQFKFIANGTEEMRNIGTIGSTVQFSMEGTVIGMNPNTNITNFMNSHRQYVAIGYDNQ